MSDDDPLLEALGKLVREQERSDEPAPAPLGPEERRALAARVLAALDAAEEEEAQPAVSSEAQPMVASGAAAGGQGRWYRASGGQQRSGSAWPRAVPPPSPSRPSRPGYVEADPRPEPRRTPTGPNGDDGLRSSAPPGKTGDPAPEAPVPAAPAAAPPAPPQAQPRRSAPLRVVLVTLLAVAVAVAGATIAATRRLPPPRGASTVTAASPAPARGSLEVTSTPEGCSIWVNGKLLAARTPAQIDDLPLGAPLQIQVTRDGFDVQLAEVRLTEAEPSKILHAEMKATVSPPAGRATAPRPEGVARPKDSGSPEDSLPVNPYR